MAITLNEHTFTWLWILLSPCSYTVTSLLAPKFSDIFQIWVDLYKINKHVWIYVQLIRVVIFWVYYKVITYYYNYQLLILVLKSVKTLLNDIPIMYAVRNETIWLSSLINIPFAILAAYLS